MSSSTVSKLDDLAGLRSAKKIVRRVAMGTSGVHSLLLYGAKGSGKNALAMLLSQAWLCLNPTEDGADGTCKACGAFSRANCADFLHIAPTGPSSIIRVTSIVQGKDKDAPVPLLEFFRTAPLMSRHRVAMIEQAHRMNSEAFNALLKTLEEPHPHAKMVLTTDSVSSIPATILSRCLGVACELPAVDEMKSLYPVATDVDLLLSEGSPGRTAYVLEHAERYRALYQFARSLVGRPPGGALVASENFRALCDGLENETRSGTRAAQAEALEALAIMFARSPGFDPKWTQLAIEAHRRIVGNGSAALVFDALFAGMLACS